MPDYVAVTDATLSKGKPWGYKLARIFRDNLLAIASGAPGAPRVMPSAVGGFSPGTYLLHTNPASLLIDANSGMVKYKETIVANHGTYTFKCDYYTKPGYFMRLQYYVNDTPIGQPVDLQNSGTFTADVSVLAGQGIQVRGNNGGGGTASGAQVGNLRIYANTPKDFSTVI